MAETLRSAGALRRLVGRLVLIAAFIGISGCVTARPSTIAELPFARRDDGRIVVEVMLNERGPYSMMLDTGAGATVLEPGLVAELGLAAQDEPVTLHSIDNTVVAPAFAGVVVGMGAARASTPWVVALDHPEAAARGVLGMDALAGRIVEIDGRDGVVRLHADRYAPPPRAKVVARVPLVMGAAGLPQASVRVNGRAGLALIDTGMAGVIVDPSFAERARLRTSLAPLDLTDVTRMSTHLSRTGQGRLELGGVRWRLKNVAVYRPAVFDELARERPTDLILGVRAFETLSLIIDTTDSELLVVQRDPSERGARSVF
jgi:predicted aspartyl protease